MRTRAKRILAMTVMIVDDNPRIREMIRLILEPTGAAVCECSDGAEAVAAYPEIHPDVVFMDIEMKTMNGFDASTAILAGDPRARIVIVTQYDDTGYRRKALEIGAEQYVLKDRLMDLLTIVRSN